MVGFFYRRHISYLSRRVVFYRIVWNCVSGLLCDCSTSINRVLEKRSLFPNMALLYFSIYRSIWDELQNFIFRDLQNSLRQI